MVLSEPEQAVAEMHRVLKPGGRCFIAEPRSALRASVPLQAMRLLATLADFGGERGRRYRELGGVSVLDVGGFRALIQSQPWSAARHWQDTWYQYALCEKDPGRDDT
jgi:SAM-dependent methyltransferase